jgi:uncharacterized protein YndB with AHSA1/START domain
MAENDTTIHLRRMFNAPRAQVFEAMSNAEIAKRWWAGEPWEFTELVLNAQPGGLFRYAIRNTEDGSEYETQGQYQTVVLNEKLIWTNAEGGGTLVRVTFADTESGATTLEVTQGEFPDRETCNAHQGGWSQSLDALESLLAEE